MLPENEKVDAETLDKMNFEAKMFDKEYPYAPDWVKFQGYFNICVKYLGIDKAEKFAKPRAGTVPELVEEKADEKIYLYGLECQDCKEEFTEVGTRDEVLGRLECPKCGSHNIDDCEEIKQDIKSGRLKVDD